MRELENLVEAAASLSEGEITAELVRSLLETGHLPGAAGDGGAGEGEGGDLSLAEVERRHIERVLRLAEGNKSAAAKILGVDRRTLQRKGF